MLHGKLPMKASTGLMGGGPFLEVELKFVEVGDMRQNGASDEGVGAGRGFCFRMS